MEREPPAALPRYRECFVCGRANPAGLGLQFARERGEDAVSATWVPRPRHLGYRDRVHGGVIAAALDEAMGWAPCRKLGRFCYSVELSVRYRRPLPIGTTVRVEGRVVEARRRLARSEGRIVDDEGTVYATAEGKYVPLSEEETREVIDYLYLEADPERSVTPEDL